MQFCYNFWSILFFEAEKCEFHVSSVSFLGYVISPGNLQMGPTKVSAVLDWPIPDSRKQLQRFLGFTNFYCRFVRNNSSVAAPLTTLTSVKKPFLWFPEADADFQTPKERFTSAPNLRIPDPELQFTVEVDTSDVGMGAVLSQRAASDGKLHPCVFFAHRLSPTKRNYDIGNRELLAVKLVLEEWRHWLDHKNLQYISSASSETILFPACVVRASIASQSGPSVCLGVGAVCA